MSPYAALERGELQREVVGGDDCVRGRLAIEAFRERLGTGYDLTLSDTSLINDFWFEISAFRLSNAALEQTRSVAQEWRHVAAQDADRGGDILICLFLEGSATCTVLDRSAQVARGDVLILDGAQTFAIATSSFTKLTLRLDRDVSPSALRRRSAHATVMSRHGAAGRLIGNQLLHLFSLADGLDRELAEVAVDAVARIAARAVEGAGYAEQGEPADDRARLEDRKRKALAFIDAELDDPSLSPQRIAKHLGLSRATVYRLFPDEDGLRGLILRRRLDSSLRALLGVSASRRPLRDIALAFGFQSEAHYSRCFRARFGLPPRKFSQAVERPDPTPPGPTSR